MKRIFTILIVAACLVSCEQFIELDAPKTQIVSTKVFENDAGVRAALAGVYSQMMNNTAFASGGSIGVTAIAGLSADELENHSTIPAREAIFNNSLTGLNTVSTLWNDIYLAIYNANAILEGIEGSTGATTAVKDQATGEALFIRAFAYFYLANFYGDVPLLTSTDYRVNRVASRTPLADVYTQIEEDLIDAQDLLLEDYSFSDGEKVEPNKWAVTALLARTYLYQEKWAAAEAQASSILESRQFSLPDLNSVFLANSDEAIWQLKPVSPRLNTFDGPYFYGGQFQIVDVSVSTSVTDVFEVGDARATSWIATATAGDLIYNYPYKYKVVFGDQPLTEYQMVFRLAEQYLIRAEARAMQNDLPGAIDDVNAIRSRAGLNPIDVTGLTQQQVLGAVEQERRAELFIEWGHRWFDLKRTGKIDAVLGPVKPDWQSRDALFPIPQTEINANPNLKQNP
jgi:hypothetical protein